MQRPLALTIFAIILVSRVFCEEPIEVRWDAAGTEESTATIQLWNDGTVVFEGMPPRLVEPRLPAQSTLRVSGSVNPHRIECFRRAIRREQSGDRGNACLCYPNVNPLALHQLGEARFTKESALQADVSADALALYVDCYIGLTNWFSPLRSEETSVAAADESPFPITLVNDPTGVHRQGILYRLVLDKAEDHGLVATYSIIRNGEELERVQATDLSGMDCDLLYSRAHQLRSGRYPNKYVDDNVIHGSTNRLSLGDQKYAFTNCLPVPFENLLFDQLYPLRSRLKSKVPPESRRPKPVLWPE